MESHNDTRVSEFLLLGFSQLPQLQPLLYGLFLSMYLLTVLGNLLIILAAISDPRLHTPMYFFLSNLSLVDIGFTSTTIPKMLLNLHTHSRAVSYAGCVAQMFFFLLFAGLDNFLLVVMAYDRFVAICHPLRYAAIVGPWRCSLLVLGSWVTSALNSSLQSFVFAHLSFCSDVEVPHFFCEPNQVVHLACSDTFLINVLMDCAAGLLGGSSLAGILYSYSRIVSSIRAMSSAQGRYKAFSTCASHLSVVSLFYGTILGVYLSSTVAQDPHSTATASVMYSVVTPMLNPFIYSLRNKDLKRALRTLLQRNTKRAALP
ncbi:olfactory receptor 7A10-like [Dipodomys spectabilis]|uniref:olfactory receptor 7A10-like n=1 Tax=Dipodomys spectabilis TaxID=105255 RepID=UPI001C540FAF|nr:olfactory receptor 7A10-like [Dipodomys spectabilis]